MIKQRLVLMLQLVPRPNLINLLILHSLFWFSFTCLTHIGMSIHHDMAENYAWGQVFEWGTFKHPPLIGWITGLWFRIVPENNITYFVLSYFNVGMALWGIVQLAQVFQKIENDTQEDFVWWVLALSVLTIAYATASTSRFNPNTLLLSLWPWTAYFFISSINYSGKHQYLKALGLGLMASLCMLGKYFSGVLLLSLFIISFSNKAYRRWYCTPYPYIALLCMVASFVPHVLWLYKMNFPSIEYMHDKMWLEIRPGQLISFALSGVYFFILPWVIFAYFRFRKDGAGVIANETKLTKQNRQVLTLLVILPAANALVFAVLFHAAKVGSSFAYPIWFALPILIATLLKPYINQNNTRLLWKIIMVFWVSMSLLLCIFFSVKLYKKESEYYVGSKEMALALQNEWDKKMHGEKIFKWVAGPWGESASLAFYLPTHPKALSGFPDLKPALINPYLKWKTENGVLICHFFQEKVNPYTECERQTEQWLEKYHQQIDKRVLCYKSNELKSNRLKVQCITAYWYFAVKQDSK